jgi:hypothetical protein
MNTPSVGNSDDLGPRKRKVPAADPLNSEIERLAAAAARKRARTAASSASSRPAPKTKVTEKNSQQATSESGSTIINTQQQSSKDTLTKKVPVLPTTTKPNQKGSHRASVEVDHDESDIPASNGKVPKNPNRILEHDDDFEDGDKVEEVAARPAKTKTTARQQNIKKQPAKGEKKVSETPTDSDGDSESAAGDEESAEKELGEFVLFIPGDL